MMKHIMTSILLLSLFSFTGCETKNPVDEGSQTVDAAKDAAKKANEAVEKSMKCQAGKCQSGKCQQGK